MHLIEATIKFYIETEFLPPEIPGEGTDDDCVPPVSGAEQVAYEVFKRIQDVLPEKVYAVIAASTIIER